MKKRAVSMILAAAMVCGMMAANVSCVSAKGSDEGKVINIYSWNDEFRQRLEAIYPEVESTSKDGTVTKLKDRDPLDRKSEPGWRISAETG